MIVLDTNVLSEALRVSPDETVLEWLAIQDPTAVFISTITQAEILYGVELLPAGGRRLRLASAVEKLFEEEFRGRILPFDVEGARMFPKVVAHRRKLGRPISQFDAMIASICRCYGASVATRNASDFEHCGIPIVNPWKQ